MRPPTFALGSELLISSSSPEDRGEERRSDEALCWPTLRAGLDRGLGRGRNSRGEPPCQRARQGLVQVLRQPDLSAVGVEDQLRQGGRLRRRHGECDRKALEGQVDVRLQLV